MTSCFSGKQRIIRGQVAQCTCLLRGGMHFVRPSPVFSLKWGSIRCACRVLLPEIERAFRVQFFNNKTAHISNGILEKLTDGRYLEDFVMDNPLVIDPFRALIDHLYKHVDDQNRVQFANLPIPNRHAAIHGHSIYSSAKNSFNMIIMTGYLFQIVTQVTSP